MKNHIYIATGNLEEIVQPMLGTLSPAQWALLSQGLSDSQITTVLGDIITTIFQQCVENALRILIPQTGENLQPGVKTATPTESIRVSLTNMISTEIANVLHVEPEFCPEGEELNILMQEEISSKVTSLTNEMLKSPNYPEESAVYVSRHFTNWKNYVKMIQNTLKCVQQHINRVKTGCFVKYSNTFMTKQATPKAETTPDFSETRSLLSIKSHFDQRTATKSIFQILTKHTKDLPDVDSTELLHLSEEIRQTVHKDLHYCMSDDSAAKCSCIPHINILTVMNMISRFFLCHRTAPGNKQSETTSTREFSKFIAEQFRIMVSSLEKSLHSTEKLVKLENDCSSNGWKWIMLNECISELSLVDDSTQALKIDGTDCFLLMYLNCIKPQIMQLCAEPMENPLLNETTQKLERELTDKLYFYLLGGHFHPPLVRPKRKFLSDSVLSLQKVRDISGQIQISPDVLYARTQEE
ncbi:uncharacterized protein LOC119796233 [Cyprinodon tularosa]|uniref:uncharacterized protein LOC119796233 n=1 Tax=Cyprinodon tularosa TaxID=77115 RepID=UPI0018E27F08|nr:uncharacterized protein LOC119796233 [Cyprinodon tularosa]